MESEHPDIDGIFEVAVAMMTAEDVQELQDANERAEVAAAELSKAMQDLKETKWRVRARMLDRVPQTLYENAQNRMRTHNWDVIETL